MKKIDILSCNLYSHPVFESFDRTSYHSSRSCSPGPYDPYCQLRGWTTREVHFHIQYRVRGKWMVGPYKKAIQREVARDSPVGDAIRNEFNLTSPNISLVLSPVYHSLILPAVVTCLETHRPRFPSQRLQNYRAVLYELSMSRRLLSRSSWPFQDIIPVPALSAMACIKSRGVQLMIGTMPFSSSLLTISISGILNGLNDISMIISTIGET